jgi:hydroxyacylglutathione hydrolase
MPVVPIACLEDNYAYALYCEGNDQAIVVDPSEAQAVVDSLERLGLRLGGLLLTHHHWDHVGGVGGLLARHPHLPVVAHVTDGARLSGVTLRVDDGQGFDVAGHHFDVMHVPGHTLGAVAYRWQNAVFTGDTLFAAGCGRLFEGTAEQMYVSLRKLAALPPETEMYCGHEYALRNLAFAAAIEPGNDEIAARIEQVRRLRDAGQPSVPSTIGQELRTNPFLRCDQQEFRQRAPTDRALVGAALFAEIRKRRNGF